MTYLALLCLLLGIVFSYNGYQTLRNPLPQYSIRYSTSSHRGLALALLLLGLFLCCSGIVLGIVTGMQTMQAASDASSCYT